MIGIKYHEAAEEELLNEIGYLELRARGLGRRLYNEVKHAERRLVQFPEVAPEVAAGIRKYPLREFRFSLLYSIEKDGLLILAVAHHRRKPGYWVRRLEHLPAGPPAGA